MRLLEQKLSAKNATSNYIGIDDINADTVPDFGSIHGNLFHPTGWSMIEWRKYFEQLLTKYSVNDAVNKWISYWNQQVGIAGTDPAPEDINYFAKYGIKIGHNVLGSVDTEVGKAYDKTKTIVGDAADDVDKGVKATGNLIDGLGGFFKSTKWLIPGIIVVVLIIVVMIVWKTDTNKAISKVI